jgi:hypothetical protein
MESWSAVRTIVELKHDLTHRLGRARVVILNSDIKLKRRGHQYSTIGTARGPER